MDLMPYLWRSIFASGAPWQERRCERPYAAGAQSPDCNTRRRTQESWDDPEGFGNANQAAAFFRGADGGRERRIDVIEFVEIARALDGDPKELFGRLVD
jgi:hypothetical protein